MGGCDWTATSCLTERVNVRTLCLPPPLPSHALTCLSAWQGLSAEERQDRHKVLEARMKQLHLDGLVELGQEAAKWVV